jgi:hypothetical protein
MSLLSRRPVIFVRRVDQCNQFLEPPDVIGDVQLDRWRRPQRLVPGGEIVDAEV